MKWKEVMQVQFHETKLQSNLTIIKYFFLHFLKTNKVIIDHMSATVLRMYLHFTAVALKTKQTRATSYYMAINYNVTELSFTHQTNASIVQKYSTNLIYRLYDQCISSAITFFTIPLWTCYSGVWYNRGDKIILVMMKIV